eukprot:9162368-Lingulodinium_polyedra.AAC.1
MSARPARKVAARPAAPVSYYDKWARGVRAQEVDLCAVDEAGRKGGRRLQHDITVDSGAGKSVMNPADVPEYE